MGQPTGVARLEQARLRADQLQAALDSRPAIARAVGILMNRTGVDADQAFARLRAMRQQGGRRIVDVAGEITTMGHRHRHRR